jgi:putative oxidoreductase
VTWLNRYADPVYCIVRIVIGLMFACHGGQKILGFPPGGRGVATNPTGLVAGWIELAGGFLIAFGLLTRLAAFIASGEMATAYFMASLSGKIIGHTPTVMERLLPVLNKGELPVVCCFVFFLYYFLRTRALEHRCSEKRCGASPSRTGIIRHAVGITSTALFL